MNRILALLHRIDWPTTVIAAAAVAQAVFAGFLWKLQRTLEKNRIRTSVSAVLESRRPDPQGTQQPWIRVENSSGVGIKVNRLLVVISAEAGQSKTLTMDMRRSIPPWGSRDSLIHDDFLKVASEVYSATGKTGTNPTVHVILRPYYEV